MSFSNSSGDTLALPSPTHGHHIDVSSAVRNLRRSISRSPSQLLSRTSQRSPDTSRPASPQSPCRRLRSTPHNSQQHLSHSPHAHTAPPANSWGSSTNLQHSSVFSLARSTPKISLRSSKSRTLSPRPLGRARASPQSPFKRALNVTSDSGNSAQTPSALVSALDSPVGQENNGQSHLSPLSRYDLKKPSRHSLHLDVSGGSQCAFSKALDFKSESVLAMNGALKRSDATMNLDQPHQGSPVAKRRSLHGISSIDPTGTLSFLGSDPNPTPNFNIHEDIRPTPDMSEMPSRTPHRDPLATPTPLPSLPKRASSLRKSTLQHRHGDKSSLSRRTGERQLAQMGSSDSSSPGRLRPRLSTEHFFPPSGQQSIFSSNAPLPNPSMHLMESKGNQQPHPLSKTLSLSSTGSSLSEEQSWKPPTFALESPQISHPFSRSLPVNAPRPSAPEPSDGSSAATPEKPQLFPGAFRSTGLISKFNRNPEVEAEKKFVPPDTPCKKQPNIFNTFPPHSGSVVKKKKKNNNNRNSYNGFPSTPFNPTSSQQPDTFGEKARGMSIFQRGNASRSSRKLLLDELDDSQPFGEFFEDATSSEHDAPLTPTREFLTTSLSNVSEQSLESPSMNRTFAPPVSAVRHPPSQSTTSSPSGRHTPQTPQENMLPLSTSRLSISHPAGEGISVETGMPPPVTPTTRDFRSSTSMLVTPVNGRSTMDIESSLSSRFDSVAQIGEGEFSVVYRVTKEIHNQDAFDVRASAQQYGSTLSPAKTRVYAVKKTRRPFQGFRDKQDKLREARILKALASAEHVVHYIDDWEHQQHLYIQTEYCEEGTLSKFLFNVGRKGRLDDFRIFKILQDLCLGLREIHQAGFMHLDMKPANILVDFEGTLKIGDFGLAQDISTTKAPDIEGDREYMAPEVMNGVFGPSADIFSLGLTILETAANVELPPNGESWLKLRSGDLSEVPSLTWNSSSEIHQDITSAHSDDLQNRRTHNPANLFGSYKRSELQDPPDFMVNADDPSSLDSIVKWMTARLPEYRPVADQILDLEGLRWVAECRSAPTTVFEGHWGPAQFKMVSFADDDTEMTDV